MFQNVIENFILEDLNIERYLYYRVIQKTEPVVSNLAASLTK